MPFEGTIRPAKIADAVAIADVQTQTWQSAYRGIVEDSFLERLSTRDRSARWVELLSAPDQRHFVAETRDGAVIGFSGGGRDRELLDPFVGEIYAIYVLPAHQRRGAGRALVAAVANWLHALICTRASVWTLAESPYRRFYERLGGRFARQRFLTIGSRTLHEARYEWNDLIELAKAAVALETTASPDGAPAADSPA